MIALILGLTALLTQPSPPPPHFIVNALTLGQPTVVYVDGEGSPVAFEGITWPCDDEQCYAGAVLIDGTYSLETGP